jgi:hypothetical protein
MHLMLLALPDGVAPLVPPDVFRRASVREFLTTVELLAPGLVITADRAVAFGLLAAPRVRAGELAEVRMIGLANGYSQADVEVLIVAALRWLLPGDVEADLAHFTTSRTRPTRRRRKATM